MHHALRAGRLHHRIVIGMLDPEARAAGHVIAQRLELARRVALATVHREHAPALRSAVGGVLEIVVEDQNVAWCSIERDRRNLAAVYAPEIFALANAALEFLGKYIADAMAAGDDAQRASVAVQLVEVEGDFDMAHPAAPAIAIGVPAGVADVEVAVAAHIVEVVAENAGGDIVDARVIQQRVEVRALVNELN